MNELSLKENTKHGTAAFPVALYLSVYPISYQWHYEDEFILMLEGEADYYIHGVPVTLRGGECAFCEGRLLHSMSLENNRAVRFAALVFRRDYLFGANDICSEYFPESTAIFRHFRPEIPEENDVIRLMDKIRIIFAERKGGFELEVKSLLLNVFSAIYRNKLYSRSETKTAYFRFEKEILATLEYIHSEFASEIKVKRLADTAGYSTPYFERIFRAYTGVSPMEYIIELRLRRARELLTSSHMSVTEISEACGFANVSYFIRRFKEVNGITPDKFRRITPDAGGRA